MSLNCYGEIDSLVSTTRLVSQFLCNDRQQAFETAYEKAMSIHKNMCMKDKDFSNKWYYAGIELITVITDYWR